MSWGVRDLTVRFGRRLALDEVSLEASPGEVTGVVGGDGAGKTTLLRALVGALSPTSGEVCRPEDRRIGYLASTSGTYPDLSVDENLEFAASAYGVGAREAAARAADLLDRTGLADARDRLVANLSGGMRQKLGVVRALLHRPELVVLDEPTTGVDPVSRADLWWLIARAAAEGAAVVFATTYVDEAERAGRVVVLDAGRPLASGSPRDIVASLPGTIRAQADRPPAPMSERAWRRRDRWCVWDPAPDHRRDGAADVTPDLQDAVTVLALAGATAQDAGATS